jgi:hypothetical protein
LVKEKYYKKGEGEKMELMNHYTLNTGDVRKSNFNEIDTKIIYELKNMVRNSMSEKGFDTPLMDDGIKYNIKSAIEKKGFMCTLGYYSNTGDLLPILEIVGSKFTNEPYKIISNLASELEKVFKFRKVKTKINKLKKPYVVDYIYPTVSIYMLENMLEPKDFSWTGDFCRCLGWIMLKECDNM